MGHQLFLSSCFPSLRGVQRLQKPLFALNPVREVPLTGVANLPVPPVPWVCAGVTTLDPGSGRNQVLFLKRCWGASGASPPDPRACP